MSLSGPQHAKKAEDLLWQAGTEKNPTEKALLLDEGNVHATLAMLAAFVHGGGMSKEQADWWEKNGVRT